MKLKDPIQKIHILKLVTLKFLLLWNFESPLQFLEHQKNKDILLFCFYFKNNLMILNIKIFMKVLYKSNLFHNVL